MTKHKDSDFLRDISNRILYAYTENDVPAKDALRIHEIADSLDQKTKFFVSPNKCDDQTQDR